MSKESLRALYTRARQGKDIPLAEELFQCATHMGRAKPVSSIRVDCLRTTDNLLSAIAPSSLRPLGSTTPTRAHGIRVLHSDGQGTKVLEGFTAWICNLACSPQSRTGIRTQWLRELPRWKNISAPILEPQTRLVRTSMAGALPRVVAGFPPAKNTTRLLHNASLLSAFQGPVLSQWSCSGSLDGYA